jgi:hypothetical protein
MKTSREDYNDNSKRTKELEKIWIWIWKARAIEENSFDES